MNKIYASACFKFILLINKDKKKPNISISKFVCSISKKNYTFTKPTLFKKLFFKTKALYSAKK